MPRVRHTVHEAWVPISLWCMARLDGGTRDGKTASAALLALALNETLESWMHRLHLEDVETATREQKMYVELARSFLAQQLSRADVLYEEFADLHCMWEAELSISQPFWRKVSATLKTLTYQERLDGTAPTLDLEHTWDRDIEEALAPTVGARRARSSPERPLISSSEKEKRLVTLQAAKTKLRLVSDTALRWSRRTIRTS
jgi:hypothetical protein